MSFGHIVRSPWTRFGLGVAVVLAVYIPIFPGLVHEWSAFPSMSHGFVVPFIAAALFWARRARLADRAIAPSWWGLPVLVAGLAVYAAGTLAREPFVARVSLLMSLAGVIAFVAGGGVARVFLPSVAYLAFMIPLPYITVQGWTDQLRAVEATASARLLPFFGVPVLQEGFLLHLPNTTLQVAEVCSSVPAMMSLLALGAAFGYITRRPRSVHAMLILAAVPLGLVSNIVRIVMTSAGVHYVGPIVLQSVFHSSHGTVVFLMTVGALTMLDNGLMRLRSSQP